MNFPNVVIHFSLAVRLVDQPSSDSQCSPTDELSSKGTAADLIETIESSPVDTPDATLNVEEVDPKPFEEAGVFITDDEITVDVSNTTGLRKTGFSDDLYSDSLTKKTFSKIPRSPMARRKSIDSCSINSDNATNTGLPILSRKMPVYRSVRKSSSPNIELNTTADKITTSPKKDNISTWNGRSVSASKKRPTVGTESFTPLSGKNSGSASNLSQKGTAPFQRNSETRISRCQYDQNGRRVVKSNNTSPVKQATSPLAQQILEAAESAKNDAQMLEKMKLLLSKYTVNKPGSKSSGSSNRSRSTATPSPIKNKDEFEDFTTAWVNSNGSLDRASNCCAPTKAHSKRSSAASSCDSTAYGKGDIHVSNRRDRGVSRIPAPIRQNTELY